MHICPDLANPKTNWNKTPGYTEAETSAFARILNASGEGPDAPKFVDVWRKRHPDLRHYTYFSYRFNCREKGLGWRLDMCAYRHSYTLSDVARPARSYHRGACTYVYGAAVAWSTVCPEIVRVAGWSGIASME